jgi:hypothetical protein
MDRTEQVLNRYSSHEISWGTRCLSGGRSKIRPEETDAADHRRDGVSYPAVSGFDQEMGVLVINASASSG